jgi:MFS family permease
MDPLATGTSETKAPRQTPLPGARLALTLLLSINLFNYIDRQVLAAVVPKIKKEFYLDEALPAVAACAVAQLGSQGPLAAASVVVARTTAADKSAEAELGWLQTAFMFSYMLLAPLFGWLGDRMSRWLLIGVGAALWSFASGGSGLATSVAMLLVTRCFVGIGEAAYGPAAPTIISDLYPLKIRGSVLAWFYAAIPVGSALGYVLGGLVAARTGDWRWSFYVVVPPGLLLSIWCFFMREPTRGQADDHKHAATHRGRVRDYWVLLRTPSYVLGTLGMTAMTFALGGMGFWLPYYIVEIRRGTDLETANLIFGAILVVAGLVATLLGGIAGDLLRRRFPGSYFLVAGFSMLLGFPAFLLVMWTRIPFPWTWAFIFVACFCLFFNTGPTNTVLANVTHPSVRSAAFAINILILHAFGDAISPTIIGVIASYSNMDFGFLVVSITILLGGVLWLWGARYLERDTALAPTRLSAKHGGA